MVQLFPVPPIQLPLADMCNNPSGEEFRRGHKAPGLARLSPGHSHWQVLPLFCLGSVLFRTWASWEPLSSPYSPHQGHSDPEETDDTG